MASNDPYSQVKDLIDKSQRNSSSEHEETIKVDQMKTTAKKLSTSNDEKAQEDIKNFDESQLKSLLDEAITYRNPCDANKKSDTFKQLLKNVTEEDMKHNQPFSLGNFGLKQSNSLQNLLDDSHFTTNSNTSHTSNKKHKHRKNSTSVSVSTRRLEGGSLPIDMHHSSAVHSSSDQPFMCEYKNKKRKEKQHTVIDLGDETDEKKLMQRHFESGSSNDGISSSPHDGIEMKSMSYTNSVDLEVQEMKFNTIPSSITTISSMTTPGVTTTSINSKVTPTSTSVDSIIPLPLAFMEKPRSYHQPQQSHIIDIGSTINHNNNIILANAGLNFPGSSTPGQIQLQNSYNSVSSVINNPAKSKADLLSNQTTITGAPSATASSKEAKAKAKRARAERNEKTINVESIQGFRGNDEVDDLCKYIDGDLKTQKNPKNGIVNATGDLKKSKNNKEKVNKLKKSNSMDELWSTGRQQQQQNSAAAATSSITTNVTIQDVTLRSKSSGVSSGAKKTGEKVEKRNERRSWGTEGLRTDVEVESNSSNEAVEVAAEPPVVIDSEFHVVMKKRKVKRKSSETGEKPVNNLQYRRDNARTGTRNYNDRDTAKNVRNSTKPSQDGKSSGGKNRRKSTSSMPPSDDEYHSDGGDSVQSLPIETTKTTSSQLLAGKNGKKQQQQQQQQQKPATFSYADIAKTNNRAVSTASTEKWPSITSSTTSSSHQNNNNNNDPFAIVNFDAAAAKNHPKTSMKMSFPELVETNNHRNKQLSSENGETTENGADVPARAFDSNNNSNDQQKISYSQSLLEPAHELDTNGNKIEAVATVNGKAPLTKSKSVDHNNLSSIEHYPALEKTAVIKTFEKVKPKPVKTVVAKKEKMLKKSASVQNASAMTQDCRPAVIILNDCVKPSEGDCGGITFGFDINEGLLNGADDDVSIGNSTNNNNTCDITNTNLSCNNNLTNQPCVEMYETFVAPVPQQIVENNNHMSPPQQQLDSSNNDMGYLSSSFITNANLSPANTHKSDNSTDDGGDCRKTATLRIAIEYNINLPKFISQEAVKFNQEELISFVSDEWTKVVRNGVYYNGQ